MNSTAGQTETLIRTYYDAFNRGDQDGMLACLAATLSYGVSGLWGRRLKSYPAVTSAAGRLLRSVIGRAMSSSREYP